MMMIMTVIISDVYDDDHPDFLDLIVCLHDSLCRDDHSKLREIEGNFIISSLVLSILFLSIRS